MYHAGYVITTINNKCETDCNDLFEWLIFPYSIALVVFLIFNFLALHYFVTKLRFCLQQPVYMFVDISQESQYLAKFTCIITLQSCKNFQFCLRQTINQLKKPLSTIQFLMMRDLTTTCLH